MSVHREIIEAAGFIGKSVEAEDNDRMAQAMIAKAIGTMLMIIPDEKWEEIKGLVRPCGLEGCDCHDLTAMMFPTLDQVRDWYNEHHPEVKQVVEGLPDGKRTR